MASGQARSAFNETGKRVRIVGKNGRPRVNDLWRGLPWIVNDATERGDFATVVNGPQARPYIRYPFTRALGCTYSGWRARDHVGAIHLFAPELAHAEAWTRGRPPFIVLEPNLAPMSNPNKQWGVDRWQALADILSKRGFLPVQLGPRGTPILRNVLHFETPTFRDAAAILARASAAILPEGALHHAAAALGVRAVVLFGGAVDVNATGYPLHRNIATAPACGRWLPCSHCASTWAAIKPAAVAATFEDYRLSF